MTADEAWDGEAATRLILSEPDQAKKLLDSYHLLAGNGANPQRDDIRVASIPTTHHLDNRRYSLGLDRITAHASPARAGRLVLIGAKEGSGKTAWAETVALVNSLQHRVLFASLEMTPEEIRDRMLVKLMRVPLEQMHYERKHDSPDYCDAYANLTRTRDLLIWGPTDNRERTVEAVTQRALDTTAALLVIDHSRELTGWRAGEKAEQVMDYLGRFVRRTSITVFLLSQLRRRQVQGSSFRPTAEDFQDTSKVEQKADQCLLIWRPFIGDRAKDRVVEVIIGKNRTGPNFRGHAHWDGPTMSFHDCNDEEEAAFTCCQGKGAK